MPDIALLSPPVEEVYMDLADIVVPTYPGVICNKVPNPRPSSGKMLRFQLAGINQLNRREFDCRAIIHSYDYDDSAAEQVLRELAARFVSYKQESVSGWWIAWSNQDSPIIPNDDPEVEGLVRYQYMHCLRILGKAL